MDSIVYVYSALQDDKHIRLFRLLPSTNRSNRLEGCLFDYPLSQFEQQTHLYDALSYAWGAPKKSYSIWFNNHELSITANCHAALLQLRDCFVERILWVDAICIDQSNVTERGKQVQLMAEVYCKARQVIVWLGEATPETDDAIERIRAAAQGDVVSYGEDSPILQSINALLARPWFRRVWVCLHMIYV
jgi:inactivated superfamily I helicase